eukprot:gene1313-20139_t
MGGVEWCGVTYHERCFTCRACRLPITDGNLDARPSPRIKAEPGGDRVALMQQRLDGASAASRGTRTPSESHSHAAAGAGGTKTRPSPVVTELVTAIPQHYRAPWGGGGDAAGRAPQSAPNSARRSASPGSRALCSPGDAAARDAAAQLGEDRGAVR